MLSIIIYLYCKLKNDDDDASSFDIESNDSDGDKSFDDIKMTQIKKTKDPIKRWVLFKA